MESDLFVIAFDRTEGYYSFGVSIPHWFNFCDKFSNLFMKFSRNQLIGSLILLGVILLIAFARSFL